MHRWDGGAYFGVVPKTLWIRRIAAGESNRVPAGTYRNVCILRKGGDLTHCINDASVIWDGQSKFSSSRHFPPSVGVADIREIVFRNQQDNPTRTRDRQAPPKSGVAGSTCDRFWNYHVTYGCRELP